MTIGALIGAYQEDDSGLLRALLPLAGRSLVEYQVRCAAAVGAAPVVIIVERVPQALQDAFERLRLDGVAVFPVSDVNEAVSRFEAGSLILLIGDGIAPPISLVEQLAQEPESAVATVPDDQRRRVLGREDVEHPFLRLHRVVEEHEPFERIDAEARWAGVAMINADLLGSTARMLGDWDLQSTLLRRTLQEGARRIPADEAGGEPLLAEHAAQLENFQQHLLRASRGSRPDWASRYVLPLIEDFATEQLMETAVRPAWLMWGALMVSTPLDLVAARLASLRLRPLPVRLLSRTALWPAGGLALVAIGLWETRHNSGWGAMIAALCACAFAEAFRRESDGTPADELWLFSRRNAVLLAIPFALLGAWTSYIVACLAYSAMSFFLVQHARHQRGS